jgi:hypothetical protein
MGQKQPTIRQFHAEPRRPEQDRRTRRAFQRNTPAQKYDEPGKAAALLSFPVGNRPGWQGRGKQ